MLSSPAMSSFELLFRERAEIERVQVAHLAEQLALVAARHPYYRELFRARAMTPRTYEDLAALPLTTKDDYMRSSGCFVLEGDGLPEEMRTVWDTMYTTGSTSGQPTPFVSTTFDFYRILELQASMLRIRGIGAGDVIANVFPVTRQPHGAWIRPFQAAAAINVPIVAAMPGAPSEFFASGRSTDEVVRIIERSGATVLWGVPSYLARMAERAAELGADLRRVRLVLVTGESVTEAARAALTAGVARCGASALVSVSYGSTETQGGFPECVPGSGYHNPAPDQFLVEMVDPQTHERVADGEPGLVVLTHLRRRGTVLVRYTLGDVSVRTRERCGHCRAWTDRLTAMPKRVDALVKIKGMLVNPGVLVEALDAVLGATPFQASVESRGEGQLAGDVLRVRVVGVMPASLAERVRVAIGVSAELESVSPESLVDFAAGWKTKKFVDRRR